MFLLFKFIKEMIFHQRSANHHLKIYVLSDKTLEIILEVTEPTFRKFTKLYKLDDLPDIVRPFVNDVQ